MVDSKSDQRHNQDKDESVIEVEQNEHNHMLHKLDLFLNLITRFVALRRRDSFRQCSRAVSLHQGIVSI